MMENKHSSPARSKTRWQRSGRLPLYFGWEVEFTLRKIADLTQQIVGPFGSYRSYISTVILLLIVVSGIFFFVRSSILEAATYTWVQTDWSGGQSATNATHPGNRTGWNKYSAADAGLTIGTELTLTPTTTTITETTNTHFAAGTVSGTEVRETGTDSAVLLSTSALTNPVITAFDLPYSSNGVAFDPATNTVWNAHGSNGNNLSRINADGTGSVTYTNVTTPRDVLYEPETHSIWTANGTNDTVTRLNTADGSIAQTFSFAANSSIQRLAYDSTNGLVWVGDVVNDNLTKIDIGEGTQTTYNVSIDPSDLRYDPSTDSVWILDDVAHQMNKVSTSGSVTGTYSTGGKLDCFYVAYDSATPAMWADCRSFSANASLKYLTSDGTRTAYTTVTMPSGFDYDPDLDVLWVESDFDSKLYKINRSGTSLGSWALGNSVSNSYLTYDRLNKLVWATHSTAKLSKVRLYDYGTSGTFTSQPLDTTANAGFGTASWTAVTPTNTTLSVKVRTSPNSNMSGATDWATCNAVVNGADLSANNCVTDGHRYIQYQAAMTSSDVAASPIFRDMAIQYTGYPASKTLTSSAYDSSSSENVVGAIAWSETLPAGTDVKFQIRTAPASGSSPGTWTSFLGPTGAGDYYTNPLGSETINTTHTSGGNDQWVQYKVWLESSTGLATPTLSDVTLTYVVNAPPEFEAAPTATQQSDGTVRFAYSIRDPDSVSGTVTPSYQYSTNGGSSWSDITTGLSSGATDPKAVEQSAYRSYTVDWNAKAQIDGTYSTAVQIKVKLDDGEAANRYAELASASFTVDVKNPVPGSPAVLVDASTAPATLTLSASDDSALQMRVALENGFSGASWLSYATSTTLALATDPDTVYAQFRDAFGNTAATQSAVTPETPGSMVIRDITNLQAGTYQLFVSWKAIGLPTNGFANYRLYRSVDGGTFSLLRTETERATNYYINTGLSASSTYAYKLTVTDGLGNVSYYSATVSDSPNGQGGTDTTPPTISNVAASNISTQSAVIKWDTDELANSTVGFSTTPSQFTTEVGVATMLDRASGIGQHSVALTGLQPATAYYFSVTSRDPSGNSTTDTNGGAGYTFSTPGGPVISNVTVAEVQNETAIVSWKTDIDAGSLVSYSTSSDLSAALQVGQNTPPTKNHRITITGLTSARTYYFSVQSGSALDTNAGRYYTLTTSSDVSAPVISAVAANLVIDTQAVISWTTDEKATSQVAYGLAADALTSRTDKDTGLNVAHAVTLSSLQPSTTYFFTVTSNDPSGNTTTSPVSSFTTLETLSEESDVRQREEDARSGASDTTPPKLSGIEVTTMTDTTAEVHWKSDERANGFVQFGTTTSYGTIFGTWLYITDHEVKLTGLLPQTTYHYRVVSSDMSGNSAVGSDSTFVTATANLPFLRISGEPRVDVSTTTAVIAWLTDESANSVVAFAPATSESAVNAASLTNVLGNVEELTTRHRVVLSNLTPDTDYAYQVRSKSPQSQATDSSIYTFRTAQASFDIENYAVERVNESEAVFRWTTNRDATAAVRMIPYRNNVRAVDELVTVEGTGRTFIHQVAVTTFEAGIVYDIELTSTDDDGTVATKRIDTFSTGTIDSPPVITEIKADSALSPGKTTRVQTIISWRTNEPATSRITFQKGVSSGDAAFTESSPLDANYTRDHIVVMTTFDAGSVYQFRVESTDATGLTTVSKPLTILTPQQEQTVFQVMLSAVERTFGWIDLFR